MMSLKEFAFLKSVNKNWLCIEEPVPGVLLPMHLSSNKAARVDSDKMQVGQYYL